MSRRALQKGVAIPSLVFMLSLAACTPESTPEPAPQVEFQSPAEPAGPASPKAASNASGILNFTAPRLGGGKVVGSEFAGQNLAVWFWAPW